MRVLGLDTSNYTTSCAVFDGAGGVNRGRILDVRPGELGLRQSDALFQHVKRLPELLSALAEETSLEALGAVGASTRPRAVEGSYMPCFLAGASQGQSLAHVLGVPFYAFSHQQGHLAAAAWSAGRMDLLDRPSWLGTCPAAPRSCCERSRRRTAWPSGRRSWVGRQTSPPDS
ncbi:MAG: hypothetical protein ACLT5P_10020 [Flavonifractor plautii]